MIFVELSRLKKSANMHFFHYLLEVPLEFFSIDQILSSFAQHFARISQKRFIVHSDGGASKISTGAGLKYAIISVGIFQFF